MHLRVVSSPLLSRLWAISVQLLQQTRAILSIPDGSGALIRFNKGKTSVRSYTGYVYGSDVTAVPLTEPAVTEQIYPADVRHCQRRKCHDGSLHGGRLERKTLIQRQPPVEQQL